MPNSHTWEASKGAYCVSLPTAQNPFNSSTGNFTGFYNPAEGANKNSFIFSDPTITESPPLYSIETELHCSGIYSGRWSTEQTFALDLRQVIEMIPDPDSELFPFCVTAPEYDPVFLKLYKRIIPHLSPGVPVGFNDAGEWFRRVATIIRDNLPAVASLLPAHLQTAGAAITPIAQSLITRIAKLEHKVEAPQQVVIAQPVSHKATATKIVVPKNIKAMLRTKPMKKAIKTATAKRNVTQRFLSKQ